MNRRECSGNPPLCGIVMAGGLSSRMGRDKLRLSVHDDGRDMLERTIDLLGSVVGSVYISCRSAEGMPGPVILDEMDRQGPFGGVYSALRKLHAPLLVLSCDLPFMNPETLTRLIEARNARPEGAIMTTFQQVETGYIEALVSIYEPECLPWFDAAWKDGIRKFNVVIPERLRTSILYTRAEALSFFNINYPADFEIARRLSSMMRQGTA